MNNYKIKRNPKVLTDDQINQHKDFNKLLGNHQKLHRFKDARKPLYKNIGFMSMVVLIGIVLLMLVVDRIEEEPTNTTPTKDSLSVKKPNHGSETKPVKNNN
jgi:hypothetical protein